MIRNISLKKIESNNESAEINDALTCVIEMYYKVETLAQLADDSVKLSDVSADKVFAFNATQNNNHRLMKQMRQYQRATLNIHYRVRSDLTHYVLDTRKLRVERLNTTETCNRVRVFHLYSVEDTEQFEQIKERVKAFK